MLLLPVTPGCQNNKIHSITCISRKAVTVPLKCSQYVSKDAPYLEVSKRETTLPSGQDPRRHSFLLGCAILPSSKHVYKSREKSWKSKYISQCLRWLTYWNIEMHTDSNMALQSETTNL